MTQPDMLAPGRQALPTRAGATVTRSTVNAAMAGFVAVMLAGVLLRPAVPIDETRYLAVAWEMWQSGDWLVPTRNFEMYTHKPPLLFWMINLVWALTGVSDLAARMVAPLFGLASLWLVGPLARRLWPEVTGIGPCATVALAGMAIFVMFSSFTLFDTMLTAATLAGMLALLTALDTGAWRWWAALGAAIAFGVLAKGPVILLHLAPAMLLAPLWAARRNTLRLPAFLGGVALALSVAAALVALWLLPALLSGGSAYGDAILWTQSAGRITHSFAHARPWWSFLALLPVLLFPWVLMPSLWRAARRADWREPGLVLCAVWFGAGLVIFSLISGKQMHYLLPELPAAALVVARLSGGVRPALHWAALPVAALALLGVCGALGLVPLGKMAPLLLPSTMLLATALMLLATCWRAVQLGGLAGGAVLSLGAMASVNLLIGLTDIAKVYDSGQIARLAAPYADQGIGFVGETYNAEFNFTGRMTTPVAVLDTLETVTAFETAHPSGIILGRTDRSPLPWHPRSALIFRNAPYGIWHIADAPRSEPLS